MKADGAHTHGHSTVKAAAIGSMITTVMFFLIFSGVIASFLDFLWWLAGVFGAAIAVTGAVAWRKRDAIRANYKPNYVRSIHGKTAHELVLDDNARLRAEIAQNRALEADSARMHHQAQLNAYYGSLQPGWMGDHAPDYIQRGTITGRFGPPREVWEAEIVEMPSELEESGP